MYGRSRVSSHLCHEPEGRQKGPSEGIEAGVSVVWIPTKSLQADVVLWAGAGTRSVAAQDRIQSTLDPVPVA